MLMKEEISIFEAIQMCCYSKKKQNDIVLKLYELNELDKLVDTYLSKNNSIIYIIKEYNIPLKSKSYKIKINVYLNSNYPSTSPEVYLNFSNKESVKNLKINKNNHSIDPSNYQVKTSKLLYYSENLKLYDILLDIEENFKQNFPVILDTSFYNHNSPNDKCVVYVNNDYKVSFSKVGSKYLNNNNCTLTKEESFNTDQFMKDVPLLNETETKRILINEIIHSCLPKYKKALDPILKEYCELIHIKVDHNNQFLEKNNIINKKKNLILIIEKSINQIEDHLKIIASKIEENKKLNKEESIDNKNAIYMIKGIDYSKLINFINISKNTEKLLNLTALKATVEDIIILIKKLYQKDLLSLDFSLKINRILCKEAFKLMYAIEMYDKI